MENIVRNLSGGGGNTNSINWKELILFVGWLSPTYVIRGTYMTQMYETRSVIVNEVSGLYVTGMTCSIQLNIMSVSLRYS